MVVITIIIIILIITLNFNISTICMRFKILVALNIIQIREHSECHKAYSIYCCYPQSRATIGQWICQWRQLYWLQHLSLSSSSYWLALQHSSSTGAWSCRPTVNSAPVHDRSFHRRATRPSLRWSLTDLNIQDLDRVILRWYFSNQLKNCVDLVTFNYCQILNHVDWHCISFGCCIV